MLSGHDLSLSLGQTSKRSASYSDASWAEFVEQLQGNYSKTLYGRTGQVDVASLNLIWLPLLSAPAFDRLDKMGVCMWEPRLPEVGLSDGNVSLPIHGPHSSWSNPLAVWRYTEQRGIPSHQWVEVAHTAVGLEAHPDGNVDGLPWFYVAHGSGVSINVGRTAILDQGVSKHRCHRGAPRNISVVPQCLGAGLDLANLDSLQLIHAFDPKDTVPWRKGFRHEIMLLSHWMDDDEQLPKHATTGSAPSIMCGRHPSLFPCTQSGQLAPALMLQRREGDISEPYSNVPVPYDCMQYGLHMHHKTAASVSRGIPSRWKQLMRHCGQDLRRHRETFCWETE